MVRSSVAWAGIFLTGFLPFPDMLCMGKFCVVWADRLLPEKRTLKKPPNFKTGLESVCQVFSGIAIPPTTHRFFIWWTFALNPYETKQSQRTVILFHKFIGSASMRPALWWLLSANLLLQSMFPAYILDNREDNFSILYLLWFYHGFYCRKQDNVSILFHKWHSYFIRFPIPNT